MPEAQARRALVGVVADIKAIGGHSYHLAGEKYMAALAQGAGVLPVILPPTEPARAAPDARPFYTTEEVLDRFDGLFVPGSGSNLEPWRYGGTLDPADPSERDPQRDATSLALIAAVIERGVPLFCACRGLQELNVALGGTLHQNVHLVPGLTDHRADETAPNEVKYAHSHRVAFAEGDVLARLTGLSEAEVNSVHGQGIDRLAPGLIAEAWADDGLVEAVSVKDARGFALGVQWHPEWRWAEDALSRALYRAFGDAARAYAQGRAAALARMPS